MSANSIKTNNLFRYLAFLAVTILILLACNKLYTSVNKMLLYSKASKQLDQHELIKAEQLFTKVENIHSFDYKNTEIINALNTLKPVTELKQKMIKLDAEINSTTKEDPFKKLLKSYTSYLKFKNEYAASEENTNKLFKVLALQYSIDDQFKNQFLEYKQQSEKAFQANIKKSEFTDQRSVTNLLQIPFEYWGTANQKQQDVSAQLQSYDSAQMALWIKKKSMTEVLNEAAKLDKLYKSYKFDAPWVQNRVEAYVKNSLVELIDAKKIPAFIENSKIFIKTAKQLYPKSEIFAFIQDNINTQMNIAADLTKSQKYSEALQLYEQLNKYQSTEQESAATELLWTQNDPLRILQKLLPDQTFTSVISGKDNYNARIYILGVAKNKLVFAKMDNALTISKIEVQLDNDLKVKKLKIVENLSVQGLPVILIEGASITRKTRYVAYEIQQSGFNKILDLEADNYTVEKAGTLIVDNAAGDGAEQNSFYEYINGMYGYTHIKNDFIDITLAELNNYLNVKVKFECMIIAADGNTAVVQYQDNYVLLSGNFNFVVGSAIVTGTWTGNDIIQKGVQTFNAYKVSVSAVQQNQ